MSRSGALLEHPAVPLGVLDADLAPVLGVLGFREHARPGGPGALDEGVDVVDGDPEPSTIHGTSYIRAAAWHASRRWSGFT